MPTPTEVHLQVIAEKIDHINSKRPGIAGALVANSSQTVIAEFRSIGNIVRELPAGFKARYSKIPWGEMEHWASANAFVAGLTDHQLEDMICDLNKAETEIRKHAFPDIDFQQFVIESLNTSFGKLSDEWYGHAKNPFYLVSFTAILAIARANFFSSEMNLNNWESATYFLHAIAVVFLILELQQYRGYPLLHLPPIQNFSTRTELFEMQVKLKDEEITNLTLRLSKRATWRRIFSLLWLITLYLAIIITVVTR